MNLKFVIKQYLKMGMQNLFLPALYCIFRIRRVDKNCVLLADAHHTELPFSMKCLYAELKKTDLRVQTMFSDYGKDSFLNNLKNMVRFMWLYAGAGCLVICDNFLPAASCKKRKETTVIQLWHACGALKKFGYDTSEDIPVYYRGNVQKNCDVVTVSSAFCIRHFASAMGLEKTHFLPLGISRTDLYYREEFLEEVKRRFAAEYPGAAGKKVILWAPTFRGNAALAHVCGEEALDALQERLGEEWYVIKSLHPHLQKEKKKTTLTAEELLVVTDLLITDYSSILFDYLILKKPLVRFAPDLEEYERERGFYMDYRSLPGALVTDEKDLYNAVQKETENRDEQAMEHTFQTYMDACDGHATERILKLI